MVENSKLINTKIRRCEVCQYWEFYDVNKIAVVESRVKALTNIKEYCMIVHDKDITESGELEKPHFHAMLSFSKPTTIGAVAKGMCVEPQYVNFIKTTPTNAKLYLVHRHDQKKYQYKPEEVIASFDYVAFASEHGAKDRKESIALRIANGEIKPYNLFRYISIDEYARNKPYFERCFMFYYNTMKTLDRKMQCIFISGKSHTGKTTFAKELASKYGYECYISSGGKNPLDNYGGEACIILDDLRDKTYELSDFLKLTDNNTDSLIGCRFYNKSISDCKLLIVTSINKISGFYSGLINSDGEESIQLFRRFKTNIEMSKNEINIYNWNNSEDRYERVRCLDNHITKKFEDEVDNPIIEDIVTKFGYTQHTGYNKEDGEIRAMRLLID